MTSWSCETSSEKETMALGEKLGAALQGHEFVGLIGDLGAGKTAFVRGVSKGAGVPEGSRVSSPTFALVNEYAGGRVRLMHADLYRVRDAEELFDAGFYDLIGSGALLVEWLDRVPNVAPRDWLELRIEKMKTGRRLTWKAHGSASERLLSAIAG